MYEFYNGFMKIAKGRNGVRYANIWTKGIVLSPEQRREIQVRRHQRVWTLEDKERAAQRLRAFWFPIKYTREDLLRKIIQFREANGRIPLKREFNSFEVFKKEFGSWNNAIIAAGFDPNPVLFAKKFIAKDGHHCDSFTERIIDDWLFEKHIIHERHWRYGDTKMTADFFIQPNTIVEFFGLAGVQKHYDAIMEKKQEFCIKQKFRLIEIYPEDIFPVNTLSRSMFS